MATDQEVEAFLAHWGVKGMRWGVRKDRMPTAYERHAARTNKKGKLTGRQRVGAASFGYLGAQAGVVAILLATKNLKLAQASGLPLIAAGVIFTRRSMIKSGKKRYSEISNKTYSDENQAEEIRKVEEFIKSNARKPT